MHRDWEYKDIIKLHTRCVLETTIIRKTIKVEYKSKNKYSVSPYLVLTKLSSPLKAMVPTKGYCASS
jgi:hypothetical protein